MNTSISNTAEVSGTFNSLLTGLTDTIVTPMTEDLSLTKTANKTMWADGNLSYTVTLSNESATLPYEGVTFRDVIDPTIASLVENSVKLNGTDVTYTYDDTTGVLTFTIGDIPVSSNAVVTFDVEKI